MAEEVAVVLQTEDQIHRQAVAEVLLPIMAAGKILRAEGAVAGMAGEVPAVLVAEEVQAGEVDSKKAIRTFDSLLTQKLKYETANKTGREQKRSRQYRAKWKKRTRFFIRRIFYRSAKRYLLC
jgi:hypothetical protein